MKNHFVVIITGPTGVGKTDLSLELAGQIDGEIVNIDMGQFYTPLIIGTAKPEWKEEKIPHHFFDIIDEPRDFTVSQYKKLLLEKCQEIWNKNKTPILVGGSGFYIQSLFFPPVQDDQVIETNQSLISSDDINWQKLFEIDPK